MHRPLLPTEHVNTILQQRQSELNAALSTRERHISDLEALIAQQGVPVPEHLTNGMASNEDSNAKPESGASADLKHTQCNGVSLSGKA